MPVVTGSCGIWGSRSEGRFEKHNNRLLWYLTVGVPLMVRVPITFAHDTES